ncbi:MAG: hypothetical protein Q8O92_07245 [Candidatus Latescibacter sp.]|nr:hypothetical protein [Candidatus Latescibacter sp.]
MEEKRWEGVTLSSQEDLSILSTVHFPLGMTAKRFAVFMAMSVIILGVYLFLNHVFYPGYPVLLMRKTTMSWRNITRLSGWTNGPVIPSPAICWRET